ncbi:hypothetical protein ACIP98_22500 [Streptomyces sp. NPDC088354]|uniref:hypothetical protein n=1 Tax=unclassified Streptomyces TaxID=2593676 RepID=UPI00382BD27F
MKRHPLGVTRALPLTPYARWTTGNQPCVRLLGGPALLDEPWDLVTVPARQGLEAVDILRLRTGPVPGLGPVLHDSSGDSLGFLVPPGTAAGWDVPGSACTQTSGRGFAIPGELREPPVTGTDWLVPPHNDAPVTDPVVLRAALGEAARMIELADRF